MSPYQPRPFRLRYKQIGERGKDSGSTCSDQREPYTDIQHLANPSCDGFGGRIESLGSPRKLKYLGSDSGLYDDYQDEYEYYTRCSSPQAESRDGETPEKDSASEQSSSDWEGKEDQEPLCSHDRIKPHWWFAEVATPCDGKRPPIDIFRVKNGLLYTPWLHLKLYSKNGPKYQWRFVEGARPLADGLYRYANGMFYQSTRQAKSLGY